MGYATRTDLAAYGVSDEVWFNDPDTAVAKLDAASSTADSYLSVRYPVPLAAPYPKALVDAVCEIATYGILSRLGYNPEGDAGQLEARRDKAIAWLRDVAAGKASLILPGAGTGPTEPTGGSYDGPFVVEPEGPADARRRW